MSTRDVGELPPDLGRMQLYRIESIMQDRPGIGNRLLRDRYLIDVDSDNYSVSKIVSGPNVYGRDIELLRSAGLNSRQYYRSLLRLVNEYVDRLNTDQSNTDLVTDLIDPGRIPNEYNSSSRSRIRDIMSTLYRINREASDEVLSPYEVLMQLSTLSVRGGTASIYLGRYMDQYPMIVKVITDTDIQDAALIHEYIVGIIMNRLRADIPNYVYTYGLTKGMSHVSVGPNAYYVRGADTAYSLCIEHIDNAIQLSKISVDRVATIVNEGKVIYYERTNLVRLLLFQILCAMTYAYSKVGLIHRDMHDNNILAVTLPEVMAIPVMVPVSYKWTDDSRIADIQFERRWILSDVMIVVIDYGISTIRSVHLDSSLYEHDLIVSPLSIYLPYEGITGFENDIAILILSLSRLTTNLYLDEYREDVNALSRDYLRILYRMYTGDTLAEEQVDERQFFRYYNNNHDPEQSEYYYYQTHPGIRYDPYGAVIDYCDRYKDMFTSDEYDGYINVLSRSNDQSNELSTLSDTRTYYWYRMYRDVLSNLSIDRTSIEQNTWYRQYMLSGIIPNYYTLLESSTLSNDEVIERIYDYVGDESDSYALIESIYKYVQYYNEFRLNILPLRYSQPSDILEDLQQYQFGE